MSNEACADCPSPVLCGASGCHGMDETDELQRKLEHALAEVADGVVARMVIAKERDGFRAALIRLLWRSVADHDECVCDEDSHGALTPADGPTDICLAMRALGWGKHWNWKKFQNLARAEKSA